MARTKFMACTGNGLWMHSVSEWPARRNKIWAPLPGYRLKFVCREWSFTNSACSFFVLRGIGFRIDAWMAGIGMTVTVRFQYLILHSFVCIPRSSTLFPFSSATCTADVFQMDEFLVVDLARFAVTGCSPKFTVDHWSLWIPSGVRKCHLSIYIIYGLKWRGTKFRWRVFSGMASLI